MLLQLFWIVGRSRPSHVGESAIISVIGTSQTPVIVLGFTTVSAGSVLSSVVQKSVTRRRNGLVICSGAAWTNVIPSTLSPGLMIWPVAAGTVAAIVGAAVAAAVAAGRPVEVARV